MQAVALATTTFVGQNLGKKNVERAERGVTVSLLISLIVTATIMIPIMIFSPYMVKFFNENEEIIAYGSDFLKYITPFYLLCCINQVYAGALRGAGNSRTPMIIMLFSFVLFRQAYLFVMANFISNTVMNVAMAYPAGWLLCTIIYFIYYKSVGLSRGKMKLD
jgi:Na+-driven multidrug efflux pump